VLNCSTGTTDSNGGGCGEGREENFFLWRATERPDEKEGPPFQDRDHAAKGETEGYPHELNREEHLQTEENREWGVTRLRNDIIKVREGKKACTGERSSVLWLRPQNSQKRVEGGGQGGPRQKTSCGASDQLTESTTASIKGARRSEQKSRSATSTVCNLDTMKKTRKGVVVTEGRGNTGGGR